MEFTDKVIKVKDMHIFKFLIASNLSMIHNCLTSSIHPQLMQKMQSLRHRMFILHPRKVMMMFQYMTERMQEVRAR